MQPVAPVADAKPKGAVLLWLGALMVVGGITLGLLLVIGGIRSIGDRVDGLQRVPVSTGGFIEIDDPGTYRVFHEQVDLSDSVHDDSPAYLPFPLVQVRSPSGDLAALQADPVSETYNIGSHHGRKIGRFHADKTGRYRLEVQETAGSPRQGQLAVGRRGPTGAIATILGGVFGGGAMVVIGIVLLIIGGVMRSRSRRVPPGGYPGSVSGWAPPPVPGAWAGAPGPAPNAWGQPPPGQGGRPPAPGGRGQPGQEGWAPPPGASGPTALPPPPAPRAWSPSGVIDDGSSSAGTS